MIDVLEIGVVVFPISKILVPGHFFLITPYPLTDLSFFFLIIPFEYCTKKKNCRLRSLCKKTSVEWISTQTRLGVQTDIWLVVPGVPIIRVR